MSEPTKVVAECTAEHYSVTVYAGDEVLSHRVSKMESRGSAKGTQPGDVFDDLTECFHRDLADKIDSMSFDLFGVSGELYELAHSDD